MSVWLPSAPCTPRACVEPTGSATAVPRAVLRLTAVLVVVVTGVVLLPLGGRIPAELVRRWCRAIVRAAGVRVRITGPAAPTGGLLIVANHISWLDIPLLAAVRPARMVAKSEIRQWPVAGPLAARGGVLFIERDRLRALPDTVARIAGLLRGGAAVVAFPEGSTWCGRAQGHFRRAVFQAALDAGVPVQPVHIHYRLAGEWRAPRPPSSGTTRCSPPCGGWARRAGWWRRSRYGPRSRRAATPIDGAWPARHKGVAPRGRTGISSRTSLTYRYEIARNGNTDLARKARPPSR